MKKSIKKIAIIGLIIFLLMQLYQPARNLDYGQVLPVHIEKIYDVPPNVRQILRTSCYDCHSNNTNYPWYSYVQPARAFLDSHIKGGKKDLNFSEFGNYSNRKQLNKLKSISKQIKAATMPLNSYTLIHGNAILNDKQKANLLDWIEVIESKNNY